MIPPLDNGTSINILRRVRKHQQLIQTISLIAHQPVILLVGPLLFSATCGGIAPMPRYTNRPVDEVIMTNELHTRQQAFRKGNTKRLMTVASSYVGIPYKWGGTTRDGMDCSAMTRAIVRETYGIELPRTSKQMFSVGVPIVNRNQLQPGDLVFFHIAASGSGVSHVGIYVGKDRFMHASSSRGGVMDRLSNSYFDSRFAGARRLL